MKNDVNILDQLKTGAILIKRKAHGGNYPREFYLHEHEGYISYTKSKKLFRQPKIYYIKDINEVRTGYRSHTFDHLKKRGLIKPADENLAFTIMYNNHRKEVHLIAPNKFIRDLWTQGIQNLIDNHSQKSQRHFIKEKNWILNYFHLADVDGSNSLSKKECRKLLANSFNVLVPEKIFEQYFQKADKSGEGLLNQEEFVEFFHILTQRKDLYQLMQKYTTNGSRKTMDEICMINEELLMFLRIVQHQTLTKKRQYDGDKEELFCESIETSEQVQNLIHEFELNNEFKEKGLLSLDGFRNMLLSSDFDIAKPLFSGQIYQKMTRPLCDYFISTSHNTYLFNNQLSGESNPEAYNRVLLAGCRAVELDCYDGPNDQPIVTHGYTLVKSCPFESIIRYMEPNLFKTSPYPVILNIENHCSIEQEKEMSRILKDILGDRLVTKHAFEKDPIVLQSPEDFKYKVLIRCKKNSKQISIVQTEEDHRSSIDILKRKLHCEPNELFIYLQNVSYKTNDYAKKHYSPFHSSSLEENRFEKISRENPLSLIHQTTWRILRTYPGSLRQDSSNPNPIDAWNYGIQMVALNFQNNDNMMGLLYGKFLDNGGCGYILKPHYLIHSEQTNYNPLNSQVNLDYPQRLTITIISAQFLSRANQSTSDIPDPYVSVSIHGLPCDQQTQKTKVIENNGFDPIWNETFTFRIQYPQMALVYLTVFDYDQFTPDSQLARFCLPLTIIQTGYRHVHLRTVQNEPTHSTLFVHIDMKDDQTDDPICVRL